MTRPPNLRPNSICIITTSYPAWNEGSRRLISGKFVHDMAKYLVKAGFDVHVITHHSGDTQPYEQRDGVHIHRFHYFFKSHESLTKGSGIPDNIKFIGNKLLVPFYFFFLILNAFKVIRRYRIRIVNAHWGVPTGTIGVILKVLTRTDLVTTLYGAEVFPVMKGHYALLKPLLKFSIRKADAVAAISQETASAAKSISGRTDIHVIPDGIDMAYYVPGPKNDKLLAKYNCSAKRIIFFTGRMVERKGHEIALKAMPFIVQKDKNIKLLLGGIGPLASHLNDLRSQLRLADAVEMPGIIPEDDLVAILQSSDIHVLPSCVDRHGDTEGSATAAFEAMACGTPSILSRVGGNRGAIEEGKGAFYFEPNNPQDLADKILRLMADSELWMRNKQEARIFIANHYSWEISIDKYRALIRDQRP